jgi:aryl-alcohol dehydrogenase-like predicted oxidoreductase
VYGGHQSEVILGKALEGVDRSSVVIATKFAMPMGERMQGASRAYIMTAVEASLRRLNTDYIDLYQQHRPDPETPIEETLRALDDLIRSGKVRYLGNSNFTGWQIADADWTARHLGLNRFVTAQNHYNLLDRRVEREVIPACGRFSLGMLPFFPLASGMLTGKYRRGEAPVEGTRLAGMGQRGQALMSDRNFDTVEALESFARERGHSLLELAVSWLACSPQVTSVIAGATKPEQVAANVSASSWALSAEEMAAIDEMSTR